MTDTETITALVHQQTIIYVKFVSATLLVFDWALLFSDEVKHMWTSRWSFIKVLYLWTRYSPVADTILGLVGHFSYLTPQQCKLNDTACSILLGFGVYTSELIFIWRTFALWKGSKAVQYILGGVWLLMIPLDLYCLASYTTSAVYASQPVAGLPGCNLIKANSLVAGDFISLAMLEIAVVVLTLIKWTRPMQRVVMRTPLLLTLYRDGVLFFIYLSALSVANVMVPIFGPVSYAFLLPTFLRMMHSILCCRVILHIRIAAAVPDLDEDTTMSRQIRLALQPIFEEPKSPEMQLTTCGTFRANTQTSGSGSRGDDWIGEGSSIGDVMV